MEQELKPDKGVFKGSCNRTACQMPGATWYNSSTRAYYCPTCAKKINYWSERDHNERICVNKDMTGLGLGINDNYAEDFQD